jgi:hypothetical protein
VPMHWMINFTLQFMLVSWHTSVRPILRGLLLTWTLWMLGDD